MFINDGHYKVLPSPTNNCIFYWSVLLFKGVYQYFFLKTLDNDLSANILHFPVI